MVTGTECVSVPDVPVTITVAAELALDFCWLLLPPEHPTATNALSSTTPSAIVHNLLVAHNRFLVPPATTSPASPKGSSIIIGIGEYVDPTLTVIVDPIPPGMMVGVENEHVTPAGALQESEIVLLNPPTPLASTMMLTELPRATVALCADRASEKSPVVTVWAGTTAANSPCV